MSAGPGWVPASNGLTGARAGCVLNKLEGSRFLSRLAMNQLQTKSTETGISIQSYPVFIPGHSLPEESRFFFSYTIEIRNDRPTPVQLMERHWIIINGDGVREDVHGPGVVGKTPLIQPGESFVYTSFCPLNTAWGTMEGFYSMRGHEGDVFTVPIPRFILAPDRMGEPGDTLSTDLPPAGNRAE